MTIYKLSISSILFTYVFLKLWYTEDGQEMQDERWLHHYMLGKIAEKRQEPASQYIPHYLKV